MQPNQMAMQLQTRMVGLNERGKRVGETHHRAVLSDRDVDMIRELYENGLSYSVIAEKFDISKSHARDVIKCRRRWQMACTWKRVAVN